MTTIATLAVRLIGDVREYAEAMNSAKAKAQETATSISKNMKEIGGNITSMGKSMTAYVTLPVLGAGAAALAYASNLEETKNKASVVFASMTNDVMAWSANSDTAMGMSQQNALDAVSTFGAMGQSAGINAQENLAWSQSLVQLGSDWSSFYNLNPVDALNAIQSATAGQYEPLRRMGIVINQAALEQKALQMGLMEEGGVLSDAARYQALYALMVDKSAAAQGDFARTADGVANQTRIVRAQFENASATLGQQLLPYANQLLGWASRAISWFQQLTPEQQKWVLSIGGIVAAAGPALIIVGSLITAFGAIAGVIGAISTPVLIVVAVIAALVAVGYLLYQAWTNNWGGIQEKTATVVAFVRSVIDSGMQFVNDVVNGRMGALSAIWLNTFTFIQNYVHNFIAFWRAIFAAFSAAANGDWYTFGAQMRVAFDTMLKSIGQLINTSWGNIKTAFTTLWNNAVNFAKNFNWKDAGKNIVEGLAKGILNNVSIAVNAILSMGDAVMEAIKGFFGIASPAKKLQVEVAPWLAKGAFDWLPFMKPSLFEPAFAQVPALTRNGMRNVSGGGSGEGGGGARGGLVLNNYSRIDLHVDGNGEVDLGALLKQFSRARI